MWLFLCSTASGVPSQTCQGPQAQNQLGVGQTLEVEASLMQPEVLVAGGASGTPSGMATRASTGSLGQLEEEEQP